MKDIAKIMTFKLSVLTTLMLCVTANNYASDIEIYKAPSAKDGKARVMLNLDNSSFMANPPSGNQSPGSIFEDYGRGMDCPNGSNNYNTQTVNRVFNGITYTDNEYYCTVAKTAVDAAKAANSTSNLNWPAIAGDSSSTPAIVGSCELTGGDTYKCFDRYTMAKRSLYQVVNDTTLGDEISIGISMFPLYGTTVIRRPIPLGWYKVDPTDSSKLVTCPTGSTTGCSYGRTVLNNIIHSISASMNNPNDSKKVPVAQGYGIAANTLLTNENGGALTADQCSGYGIFSLTAGLPVDDALGIARTNLNSVLQSGFQITSDQCPSTGSLNDGRAWRCISRGAELLAAGKAKIAMPVKSVVVSFGTGFAFTPPLPTYDESLTTEEQLKKVTDQIPVDINGNGVDVLNNKRDAAISGVKGEGGYFTVKDSNTLTSKIIEFIGSVGAGNIPYITTGSPTIPQDPLNPALVQNDAYYSQFKPTPTIDPDVGNQLWAGNLKKYHVDNLGRLIGKSNYKVIDDLGRLESGTHDFWAPPVSESIATGDVTTRGSELYARMGGAWSQLPLTSVISGATVVDRKLLTNRDVSSAGVVTEKTSLSRIDLNYPVNDPKRTDIMQLLNLRQIGAVMHSSPLLLSNEGKLTYNKTTNKVESTNREDYVLFGSTQGILHVVKVPDYSETTTDSVTTNNGGGREVFAFVPHEMIEKQSKAFLTPDSATGGTAKLFYGIDAPWTAYTEYVPKSDTDSTLTVGSGKSIETDSGTTNLQGKQLVYGGLRMGGRSYYALDLKNMNSPELKFHINPDAASSGTPLSFMGESWSKPKIAWVNWNGTRKLVMFVGGGYDAGGVTGSTAGISSKANNGGYESDTYNQTNGIGAGVYMFDALNGDLLWWASNNATATSAADTDSGVIALKDANLKYSVVSEIKTADRDNDGLVDHLYFGDLSGQVFRIDLNNKATTIGAFAKRSTRVMNMHNALNGYLSPRFYAAPSFSIFKDSVSANLFAAISIGSGNLSHPLAEYTSGRDYDALYTIYDKDVARADLYTTSSLYTVDTSVGNTTTSLALNEITSANRFQQTALQLTTPIAPYATSAGWYFKLQGGNGKIQQEKIFYAPTVIDYDLYISSYDSSRLGLTGACGGGVQGVSKVRLFCMPFGQCSTTRPFTDELSASDEHGPGIQNHAIASGGDGTTRLVGGAIIGNNLDDQYQTSIKLIPQRWYEK